MQSRSIKASAQTAGFSLIEILMGMVLLGILAAVAIPSFIDFRDDAKRSTTLQRLDELRKAIAGDSRLVSGGEYTKPGFIAQVGSLPTSLNDLINIGAYPAYNPFTKIGWRGPYVLTTDPAWNKDGWGTVIQYSSVSRTVTSCGPNLTCGNADDITVNF